MPSEQPDTFYLPAQTIKDRALILEFLRDLDEEMKGLRKLLSASHGETALLLHGFVETRINVLREYLTK